MTPTNTPDPAANAVSSGASDDAASRPAPAADGSARTGAAQVLKAALAAAEAPVAPVDPLADPPPSRACP